MSHTFTKLQKTFVSDPNKPCMVKVDVPEVRLGAELSQEHGNPERLHPFTFFSSFPTR